MITCRLCGGLGNQLFQIFTTISYALNQCSSPFFFLNNHQLGNGSNGVVIRYTYWETLLTALKPFLKNMNEMPKLTIITEKDFCYSPIPNIKKNTLLVGYYQSYLYFDQYKENIYKMLKLNDKKNLVKNKVKLDSDNYTNISIHFRIGDYVKYPDVYPILSEQYYINALSFITDEFAKSTIYKKTNVIYFCENNDIKEVEEIIKSLKTLFPLINFERASPLLEDWEQMLFMSLCEHNIIANSTFSWWGAYLNKNPKKMVCYPEKWFMPQQKKDTSSMCPIDWKCFNEDK